MQTPGLGGAQGPRGGGLLDRVVVNNLQQFHMIYVSCPINCYVSNFSTTYVFTFRQNFDNYHRVFNYRLFLKLNYDFSHLLRNVIILDSKFLKSLPLYTIVTELDVTYFTKVQPTKRLQQVTTFF